MKGRYRSFAYFIGFLVVGSVLLDWLMGSLRVPEPPKVVDAPTLPSAEVATPSSESSSPSETAAPPYSPSYENQSLSEQGPSRAREASPSDEQSETEPVNASGLQSPAPTASSEGQGSPDRGQITTSPKSSNAALRETLKEKRH